MTNVEQDVSTAQLAHEIALAAQRPATLAFVIGRRARGPARVAVYAAAVVLIVAIGVTRVYLGAHYPSDVAAGWLTGAAVAMAAGALALRLPAGHAARYAGGA